MTDTIKTPEQIESELRACAKLGMNKSDTARAMGMGFRRVKTLATDFNIAFRQRNKIRMQQYEQCSDEGMTKAETAAHLGITINVVNNHAWANGIVYRDSRGWQAPAPKLKRASTGSRMSCSPAAIAAFERKGAA